MASRPVYEGEQRLGVKIKSKMNLELIAFTVVLNLAGCASIRVGQQVQSGRNALQTGRPEIALGYLVPAAETDPNYEIIHPTHNSARSNHR